MHKRFLLIVFVVLLNITLVGAQNLLQSVGVSASNSWTTIHGGTKQGPFNYSTGYITYFPRFNLQIGDGSSISLGVPLSVGFSTMNNSLFNAKGTALAYDVPFVLDFNNGFKAGDTQDDLFGFYFGAGIGYSATQFDSIGITSCKPKGAGFIFRTGARFGFPDTEQRRGVTVGFFVKAQTGEDKFKTAGLNLLFDF